MYSTRLFNRFYLLVLIWGCEHRNKEKLSELFRKQKRAIRMINNIQDLSVSCRDFFKSDKILTLTGLFIYFSAIHAKKCLLNSTTLSHKYNTRFKDKIIVKHYDPSVIKTRSHSILCKLPTEIFRIEDLRKLKKRSSLKTPSIVCKNSGLWWATLANLHCKKWYVLLYSTFTVLHVFKSYLCNLTSLICAFYVSSWDQ